MTDTLRRKLRHEADSVEVPILDPNAVIARGEQRLHRRRMTAALAGVAAAAVVALGSVLVTSGDPNSQEPLPVAPPSPSKPSKDVVDRHGARPLVYAVGSTVHVGDKTVEALDPVAFIDATDDGAVYEAMLDGTLWFTDGTTTSVIGTSGCTACPTAHGGVVTTGDSGSLVVWADRTGRQEGVPLEFVVFDTSRREEVARIPFTDPRHVEDRVVYVDEDQVWFAHDTGTHPDLFRFDVATRATTKIGPDELDAVLSTRSRMFVAEGNDLDVPEPGFTAGASFRQDGRLLAAVTSGGDPMTLTRTNGDEVRLLLPNGYTAPGREGGSVIRMAQWLDDDNIVVWANEGGGDLPPQHGDLLVCRLPDGVCQLEVPRSSGLYVAPY